MVRPDNTGNSKILTEDRLHFLPKLMIDMVVISSFVLPGQIVAGLAAFSSFENQIHGTQLTTQLLCFATFHQIILVVAVYFLGLFLLIAI